MKPEVQRGQVLDGLLSKGIRLTFRRRAVVAVIQEARSHLDAGSLLDKARVQEPNIDRATVYRTIELLKRLRLIDKLNLMHLEGEKHYYEVKTESNHIHLACFRCGAIREFTSPLFDRLKEEIAREVRFEVRIVRLEFGGFCRACASNHQGREEDRNTATLKH
ncbi:MAG TPA: Fur family transcriptional regulator [Bryobacteraceae bacterium]|nr:Fur family transcriptional regulator [Bryobacteraceae bacterium]